MTAPTIDIVIPVWNQPNETRNCLVNLINHTPGGRLIMVDNGSERETTRLLQEIADGLDEMALLMRDDANVGFVRAANRGLACAEAGYLAVVRSSTVVSPGWLEPLTAFAARHPEAGLLVPHIDQEDARGFKEPVEVASGSFAALVMTRKAYEMLGGFDEEMDGGTWCLEDFTRRAWSKGLLTYLIPQSRVSHQPEVQFGSLRRREEVLRRSQALFRQRWGEGGTFCVHVPKGVELSLLRQRLDCLLLGARHGDRYEVLLPAALHKEAVAQGLGNLHEHIRLVPLPRFATASGKRKQYDRIVAEHPGIVPVAAVDGLPFPWSEESIPFTELGARIQAGYGS